MFAFAMGTSNIDDATDEQMATAFGDDFMDIPMVEIANKLNEMFAKADSPWRLECIQHEGFQRSADINGKFIFCQSSTREMLGFALFSGIIKL